MYYARMFMDKKISNALILILSLFSVISCKSKPEKKQEPIKQEIPIVQEQTEDEDSEIIAEFDGVVITKKDYKETKSEIEIVVGNLNKITAERDYNKWLKYLSETYRTEYSRPSVLQITSDNLPVKGIKLKNLNDYFSYVFVPSRQNVRVDDIKFVSPTRVNVITETGGKRLLVYKLEKINGKWFLIPRA